MLSKNELLKNLDNLFLGTKYILFEMTYNCLHSNITSFFLYRSNFTDQMYNNGFCIESLDNYSSVVSRFTGREIKNELFKTNIDNLPPLKTTKPKLVKFITSLEQENNEILKNNFVILEFTPQIIELNHTIHRRLYKVFNNRNFKEKLMQLDYLLENKLILEDDYEYRKKLLMQEENFY